MRASKTSWQKTKPLILASLFSLALISYVSWKKNIPVFANPINRPALQFSISTAAYVPVKGQIKTVPLSREVTQQMITTHGNRTPLLNEVVRLAPKSFPPQTRILSVDHISQFLSNNRGKDNDYICINLNKAFNNSGFWRGRSKRNVKLTFHALARNVAFQNEPKGTPLPVLFVIEGKRLKEIGGFETMKPLSPEKIMKVSSH